MGCPVLKLCTILRTPYAISRTAIGHPATHTRYFYRLRSTALAHACQVLTYGMLLPGRRRCTRYETPIALRPRYAMFGMGFGIAHHS
eukprot:582987-Rhodomonas_salina.1